MLGEIDPRHWDWDRIEQTVTQTFGLAGWATTSPDSPVSDDIDAFRYYGTAGVFIDPKNPIEYRGYRQLGKSRTSAALLVAGSAFIGGGLLGWAFDPEDKRSGWDVDLEMFSPRPTDYGVIPG